MWVILSHNNGKIISPKKQKNKNLSKSPCNGAFQKLSVDTFIQWSMWGLQFNFSGMSFIYLFIYLFLKKNISSSEDSVILSWCYKNQDIVVKNKQKKHGEPFLCTKYEYERRYKSIRTQIILDVLWPLCTVGGLDGKIRMSHFPSANNLNFIRLNRITGASVRSRSVSLNRKLILSFDQVRSSFKRKAFWPQIPMLSCLVT